jgi:hypothetical protein
MPERIKARWPRLMSEADASEYVGVSLSQFCLELEKGMWPAPVNRNARLNTYDRKALDDAVDRLARGANHPDEIDLDGAFPRGHGPRQVSRKAPAR